MNSYSDYGEQQNEINEPESNITLRRSTRIRNMPKLQRLWYELNEKWKKQKKFGERCDVVFNYFAIKQT